MEDSLQKLKRALAGEIGMSKDLDDLSTALYNGQLPSLWRKLTPQVSCCLQFLLKLGHYVNREEFIVWPSFFLILYINLSKVNVEKSVQL